MKLDFSALAQAAAKVRGQVGTAGTPAFTRVSASPLARPGAGTVGDKPAAMVALPELVVVAAARPHPSPACPQEGKAEKINAGAVSPVSPLVPVEEAQVAAVPFEREELAPQPTGASVNTCGNCMHLLRHGTCGQPVDAGLVPSFGIVWPPEGHAAGCAALVGKPTALKTDRPHGLTHEEGDRCHAPGWDDAEIDQFQTRHARLILLGIADQDADDLAERLTLRDRGCDDRRMCLECRELALSGRCSAAARRDMPGVERQMEPVPDILMRCQCFKPAVSAHEINQGPEHASHDD